MPPEETEPAYKTVTVPIAVYRRVERWRDGMLERGIDSLPIELRAPMRAAFQRVDGKHKGLVGLGVVFGVLFDALVSKLDDGDADP